MTKIIIVRKRLDDGLQWRIENWEDYLAYLKENNLPQPLARYTLFASYQTEIDYKLLVGDFSQQIPILFHLQEELVEHEIVDG
jgi:hypothetical protein